VNTRREKFEAAMRRHFKLPNATFDWDEGAPWMTDPANPNGDIIDCDDFWFGWKYALDSLDVEAASIAYQEQLISDGPVSIRAILSAAKGDE
jgi:hypothetical protein